MVKKRIKIIHKTQTYIRKNIQKMKNSKIINRMPEKTTKVINKTDIYEKHIQKMNKK